MGDMWVIKDSKVFYLRRWIHSSPSLKGFAYDRVASVCFLFYRPRPVVSLTHVLVVDVVLRYGLTGGLTM